VFFKELIVVSQHGRAVVLITCTFADWTIFQSTETGSIRKWGEWYPARDIPCNYEAMV
jgi:hypothetical protein